MKKITKSIIALSVLAGLASCAKEQTPVTPDDNDGMVELTLTATQENPETRTYVGETTTGDGGKKTTPVLWSKDDCLSVLEVGGGNNKFDLTDGIGTYSGTFKGTVASAVTSLVVIHPYSGDLSFDQSTMKLSGAKLEENQTATVGSFDPKTAALMAGVVPGTSRSSSSSVELENVVGYVKVTPKFDCSKITLQSKSADDKLSGTVSAEYKNEDLTFESTGSSNKVSIEGDIKSGNTYYIAVLPVNMESGFNLIFTMADGTEKYREGSSDKVLNIKASKVKNLGTIEESQLSVVSKAVDLSASESANCYIVQVAGDYKFKAVQGNTYKKDDNSKTGTTVGKVESVAVLWESDGTATAPAVGALIDKASVKYSDSDNYIQFSTPKNFKQGNAVIAAKDGDGKILWSWHIWCVKSWNKQDYNNIAGTMMDRNLGATSAEIPTSADDVSSVGLLYQWGRKDPFLGAASFSPNKDNSYYQAASTGTGTWATSSDAMTADNTTQYPMTFYTGDENYNLGDSWASKKTVNDPCPAGWRVPDGGSSGIWAKASSTTSNTFVKFGMNFGGVYGSDATTIWYPASGFLDCDYGTLSNVGNGGYYWSVTPDLSYSYYAYCHDFNSEGKVFQSNQDYRFSGRAVRCCKE